MENYTDRFAFENRLCSLTADRQDKKTAGQQNGVIYCGAQRRKIIFLKLFQKNT